MIAFLLNVILIIVGLVIGGTVLLAGRRLPWISLAIIGLAATGNLLAALVVGLDSGWDLVRQGEWLLVGIAFAVAALGWYVGQTRQKVGVALIGIAAGVDIGLWLREIIRYFSTEIGGTTPETAVLLNLPAILIGGLLGWWLIRSYRDEALILVTVVLGVEIIFLALRLNSDSSLTAVLLLSLALAGVVVQYADYLRHVKANTPLEPSAEAVMLPLV
jgi:hypothetical protein